MQKSTVNQFSFIEHQNEPYISGTEICKRLGYKNPMVQARKVWWKNKNFLQDNSVRSKLERSADSKKYETRCYNEAGALFFISQCDIKKAKNIIKSMCDAFVQFRKLHEGQKVSWSAIRREEKQVFKDCMDGVQNFQTYQKEQGSKNTRHVYSNVIRTVKAQLGFSQSTKPDQMNSKQLVVFGTGLMVFEENLKNGMIRSLPYKEIYEEAKAPLKLLAVNIKPLLRLSN